MGLMFRLRQRLKVVVVKLSLIYGETPEMDNAFQLYIHILFWTHIFESIFYVQKGGVL